MLKRIFESTVTNHILNISLQLKLFLNKGKVLNILNHKVSMNKFPERFKIKFLTWSFLLKFELSIISLYCAISASNASTYKKSIVRPVTEGLQRKQLNKKELE